MPSVIERRGYRIVDGLIHYDERKATYEEADAIAGRRLDRRKNYGILDCAVHELAEWSEACSGCTEVPETTTTPERGCGCSECGYTGRTRRGSWVPLDGEQYERTERFSARAYAIAEDKGCSAAKDGWLGECKEDTCQCRAQAWAEMLPSGSHTDG